MSDNPQYSHAKRKLWFAAFFLAALLIIGQGYFQYRAVEDQLLEDRSQELTVIGTLKASQIAEWRKERLSDVARFAQGPTLTRAIENADRADLRIMLNLNRKADFYDDTLLVSPGFDILSSARDTPEPLSEASRCAIRSAMTENKPILSDFYRHSNGKVYIDVVSPIKNTDKKTVAAFVLRCGASGFLYPLIQAWPEPNTSAETLLVRKEEDHVVFMNTLIQADGKAKQLRFPLKNKNWPCVQAVEGKRGIVRAPDYRNVNVLANIQPIPDSEWFLVTKIDNSEIISDIRRRALVIFGFVLLGLLLAAVATAFGLRNRQASLYRDLYKAEQEQRTANEKYRIILYSIGDAVITADDCGNILQMNPVASNLTGWSEKEAFGHPIDEVFHIINEETRQPVQNPIWRVLREGSVIGLAGNTLLVARDGKEYPITDCGAPVKDGQGRLIGGVLVFRDKTAEHNAHKALIESERRLTTLMDNLPGMAYRCRLDSYWSMEFISQGCFALTGHNPSDLLGTGRITYFDLIHPDDRQYVWDTITADVKNHKTFTLEYRITTADSTEKWVWERGCAILNPDGSVNMLEGFIHDITERKQAAAEQAKLQEQLYQAQKIEAIGRLAGSVAHDFNNMLAVIIGNAEMAKAQLDPESPLHTVFTSILKSGKRSADLVKQLLGFACKQVIRPQSIDLNHMIGDMQDVLQRLIGEKVVLEWEPDPDLWPVLIDPGQIEQTLINLTANARDAIAGEGKIVISTCNVNHAKAGEGEKAVVPACDYVMFSVRDTGCGMDESIQKQIFEPFFSTKPHGIGTGLGLSSVYGIVKQNTGFIRVHSQPGKGTCFQIHLPRHLPSRAAATGIPLKPLPGDRVPPPPASLPATTTILLAEDEPDVMTLTESILKSIGYTVISASGPKEALKLARAYNGDIQLLITDVIMPDMSGLDLWEQIIHERPALKRLFMSGYTADIIATHGLMDTNIHFLQKPFTRESLIDKVHEALFS